jgi:hypothetical protein
MFDGQPSGADWHHHENLHDLELAYDNATAIVCSFFQVLQQKISMRCGVPDDSVF